VLLSATNVAFFATPIVKFWLLEIYLWVGGFVGYWLFFQNLTADVAKNATFVVLNSTFIEFLGHILF
jgi:hypothetical protein